MRFVVVIAALSMSGCCCERSRCQQVVTVGVVDAMGGAVSDFTVTFAGTPPQTLTCPSDLGCRPGEVTAAPENPPPYQIDVTAGARTGSFAGSPTVRGAQQLDGCGSCPSSSVVISVR